MRLIEKVRRAIARGLVGAYPPAWRERCGGELLDAIATEPVTWRELVDLLWCAVAEWTHAQPHRGGLWSAWRRPVVALVAAYLAALSSTAILLVMWATAVGVVRVALGHSPLGLLEWFRPSLLAGLSVWFAYSALAALLTATLCALSGAGRRWPLAIRLFTTVSFASFTGWLGWLGNAPLPPLARVIVVIASGWVLASVLFPTPRVAPTVGARCQPGERPESDASSDEGPSLRPPRLLRAFAP